MSTTNRRTRGTGSLYQRNGKWYGRRKINGKLQSPVLIGPAGRGGLTKLQAEQEWNRTLAAAVDRRPGGDTIVADLAELWLARLQQGNRKPSYIRAARSCLNAWILPSPKGWQQRIGELAVADVTSRDIDELLDRMASVGRSPKYVRNVLGTLHAVLQLAVKRDLIARNPVDMSEAPNVRRKGIARYLTIDELNRVLAAEPIDIPEDRAERYTWPTVRLFILLGALTGMRLGELRALRWSDLDHHAGQIRIARSYVQGVGYDTTKGNRQRAVPLTSSLLAELEAHHQRSKYNQDDALVLCHPHTGKPMEEQRLRRRIYAAYERAGVPKTLIHELRHTFGTTVAGDPDVTVRDLQAWAGWEDSKTAAIYLHWKRNERDVAILDRAFGGLQVVYGANTPDHNGPETPQNADD